MNCVEAVRLAAHRAGVVSRDWLALIHAETANAASAAHARLAGSPFEPLAAYTAAITRRLYSGPVTPYVATAVRPAVPAGHLVSSATRSNTSR